jgi:hypothetical protein
MSSEAKDRAIESGSEKDDAQAINRRHALLGTSSLVAAVALTSKALAQAQPQATAAATPGGDFSLYVRAYWPKAEITEGIWTPPPVERVG